MKVLQTPDKSFKETTMSKIVLKGYIEVPESDLDSVMEALPLHIELTQQEEGCLVFKVEQDKTNRNIFTVYEEFLDRKSFEAHQKRAKSSNWGKVSKNVSRHYQVKVLQKLF
jgi:quinol monooxygenase YgiN